MSNNDKKLDIISGIDDRIINKCTIKKAELLRKLKIRTKKVIALTTSASILCASFLTAFIIILFNQVPVYTGMSLSKINPMQKTADVEDEVILLSTEDMRGALYDIGYKEDRILLDNDKDKDKDKLNVKGAKDLFYCKPNEDFYITIHIDNPKNYEILSFTLNGKKYTSYMFEEGSDMENLVLKCNVGEETFGIVEYTLDAIKYVDGTTFKDVKLKGDKTVEVGVYNTRVQPTASIGNVKTELTSITADIEVKDEHNVLSYGKYELYAELVINDRTVAEKKLSLGANNGVLFEGVGDGVSYKLQVVAHFDNFDGGGYSRHILGSKSNVATESALTLRITETTFDSVSYSIDIKEGLDGLEIRKIYVTFDDAERTPAENTTVDGQTISGLYSDRRYYLRVEYTVNGFDTTKEIAFKTAERAPLVIEIIDTTFDSVSYSITDQYGLEHLEICKVYVVLDDDNRAPVKNVSVNGQTISGLYSGCNYCLCVEYAVDGMVLTKDVAFSTQERADPVIEFKSSNCGLTWISFELGADNPDGVTWKIKNVSIYDGETLVTKLSPSSKYTVKNLKAPKSYTVRVEYTVDKKDGNGSSAKTVDLKAVTQSEGLEIRDGQIYGIGSCKDKVVYINMPIVGHAFNFCADIVAVIGGDNVRDFYYLQFDGCTNLRYVYGIQSTVSCSVMVGNIDGEYQEHSHGSGYTVDNSWLDKTFVKDENGYVTTMLNDGRKALVAYFGNSKNIVIPEGVNVIMPSVFADFEIESVKMPSSVTEVGSGAFEYCTLLKTVDWSPSLTRIGRDAFKGCYNLENIVIPDGVTVLEAGSIDGSNDATLVLPKNLQVIEEYAIGIVFTEGQMLILPDSLRRIEANGFASNRVKVYVPKSVEYVGEYAFYGCDVYFEIEEMPDSWSKGSILNANSVVWGYKLK